MSLLNQIGKWEILRVCDDRDKDGHLLFDAECSQCGFIKKGARIFNLQRSANKECNHAIARGWISPRLASTYRSMVARCCDNKRRDYKFYGAKGIRVCKEWVEDVQTFINWAKESGYKDNLTIDRIDPKKGYCPENCRFVSPRKNSQNRRNTRFITAFGKTLCISEWARELNISPYTIYHWANKGADYAKLKLENRFLTDVKERL